MTANESIIFFFPRLALWHLFLDNISTAKVPLTSLIKVAPVGSGFWAVGRFSSQPLYIQRYCWYWVASARLQKQFSWKVMCSGSRLHFRCSTFITDEQWHRYHLDQQRRPITLNQAPNTFPRAQESTRSPCFPSLAPLLSVFSHKAIVVQKHLFIASLWAECLAVVLSSRGATH